MSESIETQGKTVNDAVSEALLQLGLRRDEVEIKVIEEPKSGLLGFIGGRPAKVMVRKKPSRSRGRGRGSRSDDDQAHSLSGGGRSRGGRSRGSRGRGGRSNQDQNKSQRGQEKTVQAEARDDSRRSADEPREKSRGGSRGRRGGRGRGGRDNRPDARQENQTQDSSRQDASREETVRADKSRANDRQKDNSRRDNNRGSGRGRGRGARAEQQVTVEKPAEKTSRSRRGSRGGRNRNRTEQPVEVRRDDVAAGVETNSSARVEEKISPVTERPNGRAAAAAESATPVTNNRENPSMSKDQETQAPITASPEAKPKAKRKGWGGGLGSRLPRKANPAVKNKPKARVIEEAPEPTSAAAPRASRSPRRESRDDFRDRRSSSEPGEVIIDAVAATRYAKPVAAVTDENLDAALIELASGMLARAGFPCEVAVHEGEYRQVRISSDEESAGMLIGRHGQTVDAVEHLVERMACNAVDDRVRMNLDINGYRERRSESLQERVADAIAEVKKTGKPYHVEPMSARERRLVHLEVEPVEGVRTFTNVGSGGKYVVIALDDEAEDRPQNED